jgi:hypothetical protein
VRFGAATIGDPFGDPLLTGVDALGRRAFSAFRGDTARRARERLEGIAVSDVLLSGRDGGAPEADVVVVASRRKAGWEPGVSVVTRRSGTGSGGRSTGAIRAASAWSTR